MAQTGDPTGAGMGGSGEKLKAEFSEYKYRYGTVGVARSMSPDSADSQFSSATMVANILVVNTPFGDRLKLVWRSLRN